MIPCWMLGNDGSVAQHFTLPTRYGVTRMPYTGGWVVEERSRTQHAQYVQRFHVLGVTKNDGYSQR